MERRWHLRFNRDFRIVAQGQLWDPYSGVYDPNGRRSRTQYLCPLQQSGHHHSPGNPQLDGTPYQLPGVAGNLIDPVAQKMMNLFPEPNIAGGNIYDNWIGSGPNHNYNDQFDIKIDHRFGASNLLSAKYSQNWNHNAPYNCFKNFTDPCAGGPNTSHAHLFTITDTHTFSPTLLLNSTLGFTRGSLLIFAYSARGWSLPTLAWNSRISRSFPARVDGSVCLQCILAADISQQVRQI